MGKEAGWEMGTEGLEEEDREEELLEVELELEGLGEGEGVEETSNKGPGEEELEGQGEVTGAGEEEEDVGAVEQGESRPLVVLCTDEVLQSRHQPSFWSVQGTSSLPVP